MKKVFVLPILSLVCMAQSAIAVQTYAIKCRPGPNTSFNLSVAGELRFSFAKSSSASGATGNNLRAGECSWVDRVMGANEPSAIAAPISQNFKVGVVIPHALNNSFKSYMYASSQEWVYNFTTKDVILTLYVYSDGQYLRAPNP